MADAGDVRTGEYKVPGEKPFVQVSPDASYWTEEPVLSTVQLNDVLEKLRQRNQLNSYPGDAGAPTPADRDAISTGKYAFGKRYDAFPQIDYDHPERHPLGVFLTHPAFIARPPAGTVVNNRVRSGRLPIVLNGAELATMFEAEKTAVWHQHVLLTLLDLPGLVRTPKGTITLRLREVISPVRQSLMQAALHLATLSALAAIWRFKWRRTNDDKGQELRIARRQRPAEFFGEERHPVLFDSEIRFNADGDILRDLEFDADRKIRRDSTVWRRVPDPYPGTPRHPAYGSGHSTYSKAASEVLKIFLPPAWGMPNVPGGMVRDIPGSLTKLADSIGEARLWGGVHWPSDHIFGQHVGQAIADCIIEQLNQSLVSPRPRSWESVPTREEVETEFQNIGPRPQPPHTRWNWKRDGAPPLVEEEHIVSVGDEFTLEGGRLSQF